MLVSRTYVKFICALLFMLFMNGCANSQINSDREALINAGRAAVSIITTNYRVSKYALQERNRDVTFVK
ncbi:hypothetical protein BFR69_08890 [Acinetobacter pittii]|jgi:hypothetical protein|uniref:Uncharacterized protein n=2 Tax=Acinetobacter pittii TaxID=48296 RepID=A0A0R1AQN4_ACIPI|nr:hypothetical protein AYJ52_09940 [Acinetobacter pittii]ENW09352.1 hypothetical protein F928_03418 [Acinetobacter pittii ATCC 19004 = CIP 70.29]AVN19142.1 hypothetical protein C6N19_15060 [Acinetobacter pittii]AZB97118.1 hypothetical protein DKE42_014095 [Acinetobacter pittii]KQE14581.1 hypothetical protein APD36_01230 [Acinetobacter pittii]